jgi:sugar-specific transcriptional regulator TrmB
MLNDDPIKKLLDDFGLTEKEIRIYIFLSRFGALRSGEITKQTRIDKGEVYRLLKSLQIKGLIEITLESPSRFIAIPFEKAIDSFVKYKREEANLVEKKKDELLEDWKKITKPTLAPLVEKFVVIEGRQKINQKISNMVDESNDQIKSILTVSQVLQLEQFGVFDQVFKKHLKQIVSLDLGQDRLKLGPLNRLLTGVPKNIELRVENSELTHKQSPRIVIKDHDEILIFINPTKVEAGTNQDEVALWTNCRTIAQSFSDSFENTWQNSVDMINLNTPDKPQIKSEVINFSDFLEEINAAKREIMLVTSWQGLNELLGYHKILQGCVQRGVSIRIMAIVVKENMQAVEVLSNFCVIKHIPENIGDFLVIDGESIYQSKISIVKNLDSKLDKTSKSKEELKLLSRVWEKATVPTSATLEDIIGPYGSLPSPISFDIWRKVAGMIISDVVANPPTEKDVLNKIVNAKKRPVKDPLKDINVMYASVGWAIIHPPAYFNLPEVLIHFDHIEKQSSFGEGDALEVCLRSKSDNKLFVPMGGIGDNPRGVAFRKAAFAGTPFSKNYRLVKTSQLQVRYYGNTLFAGWTTPIFLGPQLSLPAGCLSIEGRGNVKTKAYTVISPGGLKNEIEQNWFDAFVTFTHPESKYSGPSTDGMLIRDYIATMTPPRRS